MALIIKNATWPSGCSDNACCPYALSRTGTGPDAAYTALDITISDLCFPTSKTINVTYDHWSALADQVVITAYPSGTTVFSTTCTTGSGSGSGTIPSGTTSLNYHVYGSCNAPQGTTDQWSLTVDCA